MHPDFIASAIRRLNLNLLLISLAGLLMVGCGLTVSWRYLYNMAFGPFEVPAEAVAALQDPGAPLEYYVTLRGKDHADTGFYYENTSSSGATSVEAYYHVLLVEDQLLLVESPAAEIQNKVTGALVSLPSDVQKEVIAEIERDSPKLKGAFLPFMLSTKNFYTDGLIGLGLAALVALVALGGVALAGYRLLTPTAHPALKPLARYGNLEAMVGEIDLEMAAAPAQPVKKVFFTRRWLVSTRAGLQAMPYRDLVWGYKTVTQHRTNGIPTGKTYTAQVYDRFCQGLTLTCKEAEVTEILQRLSAAAPWMVLGYSAELARIWGKERAKLLAAVEERRRNAPPT